mmetsp:Transcript_88509/g.205945  ORF Transcript_88509/g.205945 Transcript_88509/m.205945 type:complete len:206 (+) Transcript_88509:1075-1692(+)
MLQVHLVPTWWRWDEGRWLPVAWVEKDEVLRQCLQGVVRRQQHCEEPPVHGLCDTAAVVALACEVVERLQGYLIRVFIYEHLQLPRRDPEIILCELIGDVPTQGSEETPFLDDCMEETQVEDQALEHRVVGATVEELFIGDWVHVVRARQVCSQTFRCLVRHLHSVLQDGDRELVGRIRCEPQAKAAVCLLGIHLLQDAFELGHP